MSVAARVRKFSDRDRARAAVSNSKRSTAKQSTDPCTSDRTYSDAEFEFIKAMDQFKVKTGVRYPTLCQILAVLTSIGYRKDS